MNTAAPVSSPPASRGAGIDRIERDHQFQRVTWTIERAAWLLGAVIIIAALTGVFGGGESARVNSVVGPGSVEHAERTRLGVVSRLCVVAPPDTDGLARVRLSQSMMDSLRVHAIWPRPESIISRGDWVTMAFRSEDTSLPVTVLIELEPIKAGTLTLPVGVSDAQRELRMLVYP